MSTEEDCLFCKISSHQIDAKIIEENDELIAFEDINPQAPVHFLVIPKNHIVSLKEAEAELLLGRILKMAAKIAEKKGLNEKGYRVVNNIGQHGGQTVFHIHFHVLGGRQLKWPPG